MLFLKFFIGRSGPKNLKNALKHVFLAFDFGDSWNPVDVTFRKIYNGFIIPKVK
jgi:hypothetical protein